MKMLNNFFKRNSKGFTLLELSITLLVLGILANLYFSFRDVSNYSDTTLANQAKVVEIEKALILFIANNGRLPCPASPTQVINDQTFGKEQIDLTNNPAVCKQTNTGLLTGTLSGNDMLYYGALPTRDLGLADDYMFDTWNNRFGYMVQRSFINNHLTNRSCVMGSAAQSNQSSNSYICFRGQASNTRSGSSKSGYSAISLQIRDSYNGNIQNLNPVYAIISHGANGYAAFRENADYSIDSGGVSGPNTKRNPYPPSSHTNELSNTSCDPTTAKCADNLLNYQLIQAPPSPLFNDTVTFKTRNQLVQDCNSYFSNICTNNFDIYVN